MDTTPEFLKKPFEERTDRELQLSRFLLQREANKKLTSIQKNIQFFFWITLISIIIAVLAYVISES